MKRQMVFRWALLVVLLAAFTMSCRLVDRALELRAMATDIGGMVTDIGGLATDIDLEGLATDIDLEALSTEIDIEALTTDIDLEALSTEMGGILTDMPFGLDLPTMQPPTPNGFPADIPVLSGKIFEMSGSPTRLEYSCDNEVTELVDFYRREMPLTGWVELPGATVTEDEARLSFQNGGRIARLTISADFLIGTTVEITLEGG
ncbi:MAG: hypothetical protein ACKOC5_18160 [Chloroflexota bacterium]